VRATTDLDQDTRHWLDLTQDVLQGNPPQVRVIGIVKML
jgi:hypothetical protein